jgi:hypothetical protein
MATWSLDIPEPAITRVVTAYCSKFAYEVNKRESETTIQFAKRMVKMQIVGVVQELEGNAAYLAGLAAACTARDQVNAEIIALLGS